MRGCDGSLTVINIIFYSFAFNIFLEMNVFIDVLF